MVTKEHLQEKDAEIKENRILCNRADSEARVLNLSEQAFRGGAAMILHRIPPNTTMPEMKHGPPYTVQESNDWDDAVRKTEFGIEYQKVVDDSRSTFLQEAPELEDISSQINKRLGVDPKEKSELDIALQQARGMPQLFVPTEYQYVAAYMQSLSQKLCPVEKK